MTVQDLIDKLNEIENKEMPIDWRDRDGSTGGCRTHITNEDCCGNKIETHLVISTDW